MKRGFLALLCLIFMMACVTAAPTDVATRIVVATPLPAPITIATVDIPHARITYYDITGSTEKELRAQLDSLRPTDDDGFKYDALTTWFVHWNWLGYGNSSCSLSTVTVSYDIQVTMPRWLPPANASPDLVAKWANYTHALAEHEKGHVDFVVANYLSVANAIKGATCDTAEAVAQAAIVPIRQHNTTYDAATNHGATQGANFP